MFWNLSFHLLPDEEIIDDSTKRQAAGIRPAYSIFLTNKRVLFRFDGLGSSLTQSFFFNEIRGAQPCKRLFISYIEIKTDKRTFLLNISDADYWSKKIIGFKETLKTSDESSQRKKMSSPEYKKQELLNMLAALKKNSLLTDKEFEEKVKQLESEGN